MSHHVQERHAALLSLEQTDPHIVIFEDSCDVSEIEKTKVVKKLRKGPKGKDFGTSVVLRRGSSQQRTRLGLQQKGDSGDSDKEEDEEREEEENG